MSDPHRTMELSALGELEALSDEQTVQSPTALARRLLRGRLHWAIGLGVALGTVGAFVGHSLTEPQYTSSGLIRIVPRVQKILYDTEQNSLLPMFESYFQSQAETASGRRVVSMAMEDPRWAETGRVGTDLDIEAFQTGLASKRLKHSLLMAISFTDEDPAIALVGAQCAMDAYLKLVEEEQREGGAAHIARLEEQRESLRQRLDDVIAAQLDVTGDVGAPFMQSRYDGLAEEVRQLDSALLEMKLEIEKLEAALAAGTAVTSAVPTARELAEFSPDLDELLNDRAVLEAEIGSLRASGLGAKHPDMEIATAQIARLEAKIEGMVRVLLANRGTEADPRVEELALLRSRRDANQLLRERRNSELKALATKLTTLEKMGQQAEGLDTELSLVIKTLSALTLEHSNDFRGRVTRAQIAERPVGPSKDKRRQLALVGGAGGLGLGFLIVILFGLATESMRHLEDVQQGAGRRAHFLALVPEVAADGDPKGVPGDTGTSDFCIHQIRTLLQIRSTNPCRVIAMTSPSPGAGKTSIGIGLALSFGASGSRTLLVDCDLVGQGLTRTVPTVVATGVSAALEEVAAFDTLDESAANLARKTQIERALRSRETPVDDDDIEALLERIRAESSSGSSRARAASRALESVARYCGVNGYAPGKRHGLLDVLDGADLDGCVLESGYANVNVLPVGSATSKDAEKLSPDLLRQLAEKCREQYDTVILDTGPILGSLEASFASSVADEVLFVVARGQPKRFANEALERLERLGAEVSGIVFNRAKRSDVVRSSYASQSPSISGAS